MSEELIPVRPGEELDLEKLEPYLRQMIPALSAGSLEVSQFAAGHSNLTYRIACGDFEAVLRRPPLGPVAAKAHDMGREFQVLQALHPVFPLAPKPYLFCEDASVLGRPFQVMELRKGLVIDTAWPEAYPATEAAGRAVSLAPVETLARLHQIDYRETPLVSMVHPDGYLERQVHGWLGRYEKAKTDEIPAADVLAKVLTEEMPASPVPSVIHNDMKLNNMLLSHDMPGQVEAVVDWEMATVGDPLTDLATTLSYWSQPGDAEALRRWLGSLSSQPGMLTRAELVEAYARLTGADVSHMGWYLRFAYFKVAVICQQIYVRWKRGQTKDERFAGLGAMARALIEHAASQEQGLL